MLLTDFSNIKMGAEDISKIYQGDVQVWPKGSEPTGETKTTINMNLILETYPIKVVGYTSDGKKYTEEKNETPKTGYTCQRQYDKLAFTLYNNLAGTSIGSITPTGTKLLDFREMDEGNGSNALITNFDFSGVDLSEYDPSANLLEYGTSWTMINFSENRKIQNQIFCVKISGTTGVDNFVKVLTGRNANSPMHTFNCEERANYLYFSSSSPALSIFGFCLKSVLLNGTELPKGDYPNGEMSGSFERKMSYFPYTGDTNNKEIELTTEVYDEDTDRANRYISNIVFNKDTTISKLMLPSAQILYLDYNQKNVRISSFSIPHLNSFISIYNIVNEHLEDVITDINSWGYTYKQIDATSITVYKPTGSTTGFIVSGTSTGDKVEYTTEYSFSPAINTAEVVDGKFKIDVGSDKTFFAFSASTSDNMNKNITSAGITGDTSKVTNMNNMFSYCRSLTSLDVSNFDTSKVTNMNFMFFYCNSLTSLDLSNFDTSNVTDMSSMFYYCNSLTSLDLSNFDTSNVTSMNSMFFYCYRLTSLDLSNFDTSKVTSMNYMFDHCSGLTSLDVSNFDTSNVTDMNYMFRNCNSLTSLDLSNFDTSKVTSMNNMFYYCSSLTSLDVSNFDTSKVTNMNSMFYYCGALTSLDLSNWHTSKVTNMFSMFYYCNSLTSLDLSNFDTSKVTDMSYMFRNCNSLKTIKIKNEAPANRLIAQIKTDLNKDATWDSSTYTITIP